jgi:hypothetical protein
MKQRVVVFPLCNLCVLCVFVVNSWATEPCTSGLQAGQRPAPYSFILSTGAQRGQAQCFVCETAGRPAVVVFARTPSDALGKLVQGIDKAVVTYKDADVRAWVTFLSDDQPALDPQVVRWGQKHAIRNVPLGVYEDAGGPPSYRLAGEADVTVLLYVKGKVMANFAFRAGELTDEKAADVLKALPQILGQKK